MPNTHDIPHVPVANAAHGTNATNPIPTNEPTRAAEPERQAWNGGYLKQDLLDRGWKPSMMKRWLSKPDFKQHRSGGGEYHLYAKERVRKAEKSLAWRRERDKWKQRGERKSEPVCVDLLAAIFSVNRSAKRYRDAAQKCYALKKHGFARQGRETKEELYALKDRGIAEAFRLGRITPMLRKGGLIEYRGEGYCFHSTLLPVDIALAQSTDDTILYVDAKPRGSAEVRMLDAKHTLSALPPAGDQFTRNELPTPPRQNIKPHGNRYRGGWDDDDDDDADNLP
jgi:hypothetical protein